MGYGCLFPSFYDRLLNNDENTMYFILKNYGSDEFNDLLPSVCNNNIKEYDVITGMFENYDEHIKNKALKNKYFKCVENILFEVIRKRFKKEKKTFNIEILQNENINEFKIYIFNANNYDQNIFYNFIEELEKSVFDDFKDIVKINLVES